MTISSSKPDALGELEQMVLLVVLRLDEEVYGVMVIQELEARTGRNISRPSVYLTLGRLERKGLLRSRLGDPTLERGGAQSATMPSPRPRSHCYATPAAPI
jgi:PadR family transcriptional regulator PadR